MILDTKLLSKYTGKTNSVGFVSGNTYEIKIIKAKRWYEIYAYHDVTLNLDVDLFMTYSSEDSIKRNWEL